MVLQKYGEEIKENIYEDGVVSVWWVAAALAACCGALAAAMAVDVSLPAPLGRDASPERFIAEIAHEHLVNLTSIGPRVSPANLELSDVFYRTNGQISIIT